MRKFGKNLLILFHVTNQSFFGSMSFPILRLGSDWLVRRVVFLNTPCVDMTSSMFLRDSVRRVVFSNTPCVDMTSSMFLRDSGIDSR